MKLNILPARTGYLWVKSGFLLFFYRPMAFIGFFLSFMAFTFLLRNIPVLGLYLMMLTPPAMTLGMMAIGNECAKLKANLILPMTPPPFLMAWMTLRRAGKSLLQLGVWFAFLVTLVAMLASLADNGLMMNDMLNGSSSDIATQGAEKYRSFVLMFTILMLPVSALFWFAPALMNWKQLPLSKSLFFSFYAVYKNWRAFGVYFLVWVSIVQVMVALMNLFAAGDMQTIVQYLWPVTVLLSIVFMASSFPTFIDCFQHRASTDHPSDSSATPPAP